MTHHNVRALSVPCTCFMKHKIKDSLSSHGTACSAPSLLLLTTPVPACFLPAYDMGHTLPSPLTVWGLSWHLPPMDHAGALLTHRWDHAGALLTHRWARLTMESTHDRSYSFYLLKAKSTLSKTLCISMIYV